MWEIYNFLRFNFISCSCDENHGDGDDDKVGGNHCDGDDDYEVSGNHGDNEDEVQRLASSQQVSAVS